MIHTKTCGSQEIPIFHTIRHSSKEVWVKPTDEKWSLLTNSFLQGMIDQADIDGDGVINYEEFYTMMACQEGHWLLLIICSPLSGLIYSYNITTKRPELHLSITWTGVSGDLPVPRYNI